MAVDRRAIVSSVFDSLAAPSIGPALRAMPTTDTSVAQIPFDPARAARLLDSLEWKPGPDGIRKKNGTPLAFTVLTPSSSMVRTRCAMLAQEQLKRVGVQVAIQQLDLNAFVRAESSHQFDAAMHTWTLDASPGGALDQLWSVKAATEATGSNYASYANPAFDAEVDSALVAPTLRAARPHYKRASQIIVNDAPGIWLYEPRIVLGVAKRVQIPSTRPDAWWAHLADWSIPPNQRIARDNIGLR
jgi:peptide/nickel transport system substrate-binding protein